MDKHDEVSEHGYDTINSRVMSIHLLIMSIYANINQKSSVVCLVTHFATSSCALPTLYIPLCIMQIRNFFLAECLLLFRGPPIKSKFV